MGVNLAETLPNLLKRKGMTQDGLADATGIRRTDINALANGRIEAGRSRLERIAGALEVSVLELGAPAAEADAAGQSLLDRQEELEGEVLRLTKQLARLTRRVAVLERQSRPGSEPGRAAR